MAKSKKSSLLELTDFRSEIEKGEDKNVTYAGHEYKYRIDRYMIFKDYYAVEIVGGPFNIRATTTCKKSSIKKKLKVLINSLSHK
jgi:hypothetical protein